MSFHCLPSPNPPARLDIVGVARAGDEIEGEAPKKRQNLAGDCPGTWHSWDWLHGGGRDTSPLFRLQEFVSEGILLWHQPADWSLRSLKGVAP